eukprot:c44310_g1_i1 orf=296-565(-)
MWFELGMFGLKAVSGILNIIKSLKCVEGGTCLDVALSRLKAVTHGEACTRLSTLFWAGHQLFQWILECVCLQLTHGETCTSELAYGQGS